MFLLYFFCLQGSVIYHHDGLYLLHQIVILTITILIRKRTIALVGHGNNKREPLNQFITSAG